ncbi:hypothetical protein HG530_005915 [Fusarium avenaceum]|nr:hypothetical protein HG530_005915 [Fusarium avenaceum]
MLRLFLCFLLGCSCLSSDSLSLRFGKTATGGSSSGLDFWFRGRRLAAIVAVFFVTVLFINFGNTEGLNIIIESERVQFENLAVHIEGIPRLE